ncbi:hypothetical protein CW304_06445 [Bacillus sp. UFRGS-B20]|nr:hypothetical protein CW304_06445 [Bacillus sp. UFRGS-B20]
MCLFSINTIFTNVFDKEIASVYKPPIRSHKLNSRIPSTSPNYKCFHFIHNSPFTFHVLVSPKTSQLVKGKQYDQKLGALPTFLYLLHYFAFL